jgi:CheY-like chemotaxis protein
LLELINDVLELSKIEAGQMELDMQDVNVRDMIASVESMFLFESRRKELQLVCSVQHNVPHIIRADPVKLKRILVNLVGNAVKFTKEGRVTLDVYVLLQPNDNCELTLEFKITDTGIGISEQHLHRLFQPFSQVDTSVSRQFGGTGLGLAISKKLTMLMKGDVEVFSRPNHGTTFTFTILTEQVTNSIQPEPVPIVHDQTPPPVTTTFEHLHVLVVEDNMINQRLAVKMLQKLGVHPDVASDGFEGVAAVKKNQYDVVLMDMAMPGMSGCEATEIIRKMAGLQQPFIAAMTANAMDTDRQKCFESGMDDFISKPFKVHDFQRVLRDFQSHRGLQLHE